MGRTYRPIHIWEIDIPFKEVISASQLKYFNKRSFTYFSRFRGNLMAREDLGHTREMVFEFEDNGPQFIEFVV